MLLRFLFIALFTFSFGYSEEKTQLPNHTIFDELLKKYVVGDRVNYQGFQSDIKLLREYLKQFETIEVKDFNKNEKLALYINAYNAFTIELILKNYDKSLKSIKDIKSPWDIKFCNMGGILYSLNDIENKFLREQLKESRIHFAINCASISCPPLQPYAFFADKIDDQLNEVTKKFMMNPLGVIINKDTMEVSQIFNWFKGDFETKDKSVTSYITQYLPVETQNKLLEFKNIKLKYQEYNWKLNETIKESK